MRGKAQLNAISFRQYCQMFNYKGSPVALVTSIEKGYKKTLQSVKTYKDTMKRG